MLPGRKIALPPSRVSEELRDPLWVAKSKHFQAKSCCASGHTPSPRPLPPSRVPEELRDPLWVGKIFGAQN